MADVSIKATLSGADEAKRGLEQLSAQVKEVATSQDQWAQIQTNLNKIGEEHREKLTKQAEATQKLKDHTADLVKQFQDQERATQLAKEVGSSMADTLGTMAMRASAAIISVGTLVGVLKEIYSAGTAADLSQIKFEAILKATGGTVGKTTEQLNEMTEALAKGTRFDASGIREAMSVLLTFGNIQNQVFEDVMRHAQNLSEMRGMSLTSALFILGRAYNEPARGVQTLGRYLGQLDPTLQKHIKNLGEAGETAAAQAEITKLLDDKFKDFAVTIGTSAPAAFDRLKISINGLFEEIGRGQTGGFFDSITGLVNNLKVLVQGKDVKLSTEGAQKAIADLITLSKTAQSPRDRADAAAQAASMQYELDAKLQKESIEQYLAGIRAKEAADKDSATKRAALGEKQAAAYAKEQKHAETVYEHFIKRELELTDMSVKDGEKSLDDKIEQIDRYMAVEKEGTDFYIFLQKEKEKALKEFSDAELASYLLRNRVKREAEAQGVREYKEAQQEKTKATNQQVDDEIAAIRNTVFETNDLRINALQALLEKYKELADTAPEAYNRIRKAIRDTKTEAEKDMERIQQIMGKASFDGISVFGSMFHSIQQGFYGILSGTQTIGQGMKSIWKGIIDSIIQEFARMAARWALTQISMMIFGKQLGFPGAAGAGFGGGGSGTDSSGGGIGGINFSGLGKLFGSDFTSSISGVFQDIGVSIGSQFVADIGNYFSDIVPFLGAGIALATGHTGAAIGTVLGTIVGGPIGGVIGGFLGGFFQEGGDKVVTRPTLFMAGEMGPEHLSVRPLAGGSHGAGGRSVTNVFVGPNMMDAFTLRRFVREQERLIRAEAGRHG